MAISLLQTAANSSTANASTLVLTFTNNITAGSLIVVSFSGWVVNVNSITDGPGDTFTAIEGSPLVISGSNNAGMWYAKNSAGGSKTVTLNLSTTGWFVAAIAREYSGVDTTAPLDLSTHSSASGSTAVTTGSITTTNANDLLVVAVSDINSITLTAGGSYGHATDSPTSNASTSQEDQIVSATGSYSGSGTLSSATTSIGFIAAFKAAANLTVDGPKTFNNYQFVKVGNGMSVSEKIK